MKKSRTRSRPRLRKKLSIHTCFVNGRANELCLFLATVILRRLTI